MINFNVPPYAGDELEYISQEYAQLSAYFEARDGYRIDVKIKQILNGMGFSDTPTDRVINSLSGGEKTRLALAKLLLEEPDLLILDEPFSGFDPVNAQVIREEILRLKEGGATIILSTHNMESVEELCDNIALFMCICIIYIKV